MHIFYNIYLLQQPRPENKARDQGTLIMSSYARLNIIFLVHIANFLSYNNIPDLHSLPDVYSVTSKASHYKIRYVYLRLRKLLERLANPPIIKTNCPFTLIKQDMVT